ncbi:MAG: DUF2256 domain-containing protein [Chitinophagaceae bacterium]|nr:MAG: DUF2256 domain-containing protein [Chitinophagaceae bacterium]
MKKNHFRNPSHLPVKTCTACGRSFTWRKKWEKDWNTVKYCSERCRQSKNTST